MLLVLKDEQSVMAALNIRSYYFVRDYMTDTTL